jgi:TPR repeat protein
VTRWKIFLVLLAVFTLEGGIAMARGVINGNDSARIKSRARLERLFHEAVQGSAEAAQHLTSHFKYGQSTETEETRALALHWCAVGAENGDGSNQWNVSSQWNFGYMLTRNNKTDTRGIFWIKMAARNGEQYAKNELGRLGISTDEGPPPDVQFVFDGREVPESEIERCKEGALQGSQKAALVLAEHYRAINDGEAAEYWYRIGAQNGSVECQFTYGQLLAGKPETLDRERGEFWLKKAKQSGYP